MAYPFAPITLTGDKTLDRDTHANGPVIVLSSASGLDVTMPASVGNGDRYYFYVATSVTSSVAVIAAAGTDIIQGAVGVTSDAAGVTVPTTATSDYITMDGATTGGLKGSWVELTDVASGVWNVRGALLSTGAEATPFAAT